MNGERKLNVLVLGGSGVGKTTLVNSIADIKLVDKYTDKINVYESFNWPIRCIDTKEFEKNIFDRWKTIKQIKNLSKTDLNNENIDVVWYCIEAPLRRVFNHDIRVMNKFIKGWKNIPVFVVITKSYSETDKTKNIEEIKNIFSINKNINLKEIMPVVSKEYIIDKEITMEPKGIEELCLETINCFEYTKKIDEKNIKQAILNQKRFIAHNALITISGVLASVAFVDKTDEYDSIIMNHLEVGLVKLIFKLYNVDYSKELVDRVIEKPLIKTISKTIVDKFDENQVIDAVISGTTIFVLGEAIIAVSEAIYNRNIELDEIEDFISDKTENTPIVNIVIKYLNDNINELNKLNEQEIIECLKELFNKVIKNSFNLDYMI